jgi:hypothetical protein
MAPTEKNVRVDSGRQFFGDGQYAGSQSCRACHELPSRSWADTWHSKMERWPSRDSVVAEFNDRRFQFNKLTVRSLDGRQATMSPAALAAHEDDWFFFTLIDSDKPAHNHLRAVAKVLGGKWDQCCEVRPGHDNFHAAPIRWSVQ